MVEDELLIRYVPSWQLRILTKIILRDMNSQIFYGTIILLLNCHC